VPKVAAVSRSLTELERRIYFLVEDTRSSLSVRLISGTFPFHLDLVCLGLVLLASVSCIPSRRPKITSNDTRSPLP